LSNYAGEIPGDEWLCLLTRNRDSDLLTESNFECALNQLGGESNNIEVHRFKHWACGWWEALAVRAGTPEAETAAAIRESLDDYPVLDDEDHSRRESEEADRIWSYCYRTPERLAYIRHHREQFDFCSWADLRAVVRGEYFNGYASDLIA
jgi:hypothetical protein